MVRIRCSVQFECEVEADSLAEGSSIIHYNLNQLDLEDVDIIYIDEV